MRKTKLWVLTGTLFVSLLVGAAVGRMAGGGSAGELATWSPPAPTPTAIAIDQPVPSATPVAQDQ
jgi:hypothetical protein